MVFCLFELAAHIKVFFVALKSHFFVDLSLALALVGVRLSFDDSSSVFDDCRLKREERPRREPGDVSSPTASAIGTSSLTV